jgi:hypothetical protein
VWGISPFGTWTLTGSTVGLGVDGGLSWGFQPQVSSHCVPSGAGLYSKLAQLQWRPQELGEIALPD